MITESRILQISNNVSEEFNDLGDVSFASKKELCEVIQYFQREVDKWIQLHRELASDVVSLGLNAVTNKPK